LVVLLMGFSSGLPFALSGITLKVWLTDVHRGIGEAGLFGLIGIAYTLKFLWAPLIDRLSIPVLGPWLGRRRAWLALIQPALMLALIGLGASDPAHDLGPTALWALVVAILSASQDIVIDAYRIEVLSAAEQGAGAAVTQIGYRLGLIASRAGALYLATWLGWQASFVVMAVLIPIGGIAALLLGEPVAPPQPGGNWFDTAVLAPFVDFATRHRDWVVLLFFVLLYQFGESIADEMAPIFYLSLGFTKPEYADISGIYGVGMTIVGITIGGALVYRLGVMRVLLLGSVLQILADLTYVAQFWAGHDVPALFVTIGVEQVTRGLCGAAFVAFVSGLCSRTYTATQYALLSALYGFVYRSLGSSGGYVVEAIGWPAFFTLSAGLVLPSLCLLLWLMGRPDNQPATSA
jgi:PAT family beta-lactamase induction signal transducer AmpG